MKIFKHHPQNHELIVINFARLLFAGLIVFELLNYLKILQFNTQFTWLGIVITSCACLILLEITAYKYKQKKGNYLHWSIWLIVAAGLSLDAFGDFFHLYSRYNWWDQFAHLFISAVVCFTLFIVISAFWIDKFKFSLLMKTGRLKLSLFLAATSAMSLSALYEIEEYLEDIVFHTNRLGPGVDTANDLFCNLTGVLIAVGFVTVYYLITKKRNIF
ncbi:MAG: hypothetical protein U9R14_03515 [Patescibacteria group bacterium]|nr:hypothetical protein [Patescibacteria group bacterium]